MTDLECVKILKQGLDKYMNSSFYVPNFGDALKYAIIRMKSATINIDEDTELVINIHHKYPDSERK